jgi:hypothetical protein
MLFPYDTSIFLAVIQMVSGTTSTLASSILSYKLFLRYRRQKKPPTNASYKVATYHRMLVCISCLDILHSSWASLSTVPLPKDSGIVFARGSIATCSAQGVSCSSRAQCRCPEHLSQNTVQHIRYDNRTLLRATFFVAIWVFLPLPSVKLNWGRNARLFLIILTNIFLPSQGMLRTTEILSWFPSFSTCLFSDTLR